MPSSFNRLESARTTEKTHLAPYNWNQQIVTFARRRPYVFSFLLLLLFYVVISLEPVVEQLTDFPYGGLSSTGVRLVLSVLLAGIVSAMHWWKEIGFRSPERPKRLWIYLPALALFVTNVVIHLIRGGTHVPEWTTFWLLALETLTVAFVEEVTFRGLMLRALLPRGEWTAVLVAAVAFGLSHFGSALAGRSVLYSALQVAYALAIGFGFGAMALRGGLLWPLIVAHALGNFMGSLDAGTQLPNVNVYFVCKAAVFIVLYVGYGIYLMRKKNVAPGAGKSEPEVQATSSA